ncbi:transposase, partial [Massilia eurypsychrophila]|uniref:transposase n=1 Tax=Massilia eurypsychrophila TaxID=1485217 RepID=UPI00351D7A0A
MLNFKGMRFPIDVILVCIRWYAAYPLSYRHLEEMREERGVSVDHSSINRWAIRFLPLIEKMARKHKRPVGGSWRMDETYIKVKGVWKGSVALLIKRQNFPRTALCRSNRTDYSCQRRKLVGERHCISAVDCELALADHVHQLDAGEHGAGRAERFEVE